MLQQYSPNDFVQYVKKYFRAEVVYFSPSALHFLLGNVFSFFRPFHLYLKIGVCNLSCSLQLEVDTNFSQLLQCFVVSTWASMTPAEPFIFRNYEYPLSSTKLGKQMKAPPGSSSHEVWQAVRASSAAPYYLDDFKCGNDRSVSPRYSKEQTMKLDMK